MQRLQESIHVEAPVEPDGLRGTQGAPREWTASVNGTGLRVEEVGAGAETVVFSPALFTNLVPSRSMYAVAEGPHEPTRLA